MTRTNRVDWLIFFALGFIWGSSYLFIKLAVDDFGTFTLVALRLVVGAVLLWIVVRIAKQPLPRERRIYGHLLVMAIINITIPFLLITWAEQSVESSLAAILTSPVPLFAIVLSALFLHDEPLRVNGLVGLVVGFIGVIIITSRGLTGAGSSVAGELALIGATISYAAGAVYARRNVRGLPAMIPAVFQVSFAALITGVLAVLLEHPWTATPDTQAVFAILWLGILGSGIAYLFVFRLFAHWGATRTTLVAYEIPVVGIVLGYLVLAEPIDGRIIFGTALVIGGIGLVNSRFGRRRLFGRVPPVEAT
jgi:drug/metabolite transporter (DMT)-like permease